MELRQIRYFVKIADSGSMSRAALALHVSQPSMSLQMAQLEEEMKVKLLDRHPSGVRLTTEGETLYQHAMQILRLVESTKGLVAAAQSQVTGKVKFAMAHTQAIQYALQLILKVRQAYPGVELEIYENTSSDVLYGVATGQRDIGVVVNHQDAEILDSNALLEEEMFLISHPSNAPETVPFPNKKIPDLQLILPSQDQIPDLQKQLFPEKTGSKGSHGNSRNPSIIANSVAIFRQAVLAGIAHTIQPWGVLREEISSGAVVATRFDPPIFRSVYLCSARGTLMSQAARVVAKCFIEVVKEEHAKGHVHGKLIS